MARDNGGVAFPQGELDVEQGYRQTTAAAHCGMSLRDYFAAKALNGVLSNLANMNSESRSDLPRIAKDCYLMADAMLAERSK